MLSKFGKAIKRKYELSKGDFKYVLLSVISVLGFFLIWQFLASTGVINNRYIATPIEVIQAFIYKIGNTKPDGSTLQANILTSLKVAMSGFGIAVVIGVPLGLLMGWYEGVRRFVQPVFEILRPIPPIAWIPLAILWLGIGIPAKAFIIFLAAFVPCVLNSYTGIRLTDPILIRVASIYGASNWESFLKIGVPSAVPMIFVGLKVSLNSSWTTLVAAELLAAFSGLGYLIQIGRRISRPDIIIVGMLTIGLIGAILSAILSRIEDSIASSRRF